MKKLKYVLFLLALMIPFGVKAYGIENYYIDATIEPDGDLNLIQACLLLVVARFIMVVG